VGAIAALVMPRAGQEPRGFSVVNSRAHYIILGGKGKELVVGEGEGRRLVSFSGRRMWRLKEIKFRDILKWLMIGRGESIMDQDIQVFPFVNVAERAESLGCNVPTGLALLPRNFADAECKDDLLH
jgi:hypothetical protein